MNTAGLATEQAPPLAIPLTFYGIAALALLAAGVLLTAQGALLLVTHWLPQTIAWTHLATLGLLGAAMLGSLYQMVPVVLGAGKPLFAGLGRRVPLEITAQVDYGQGMFQVHARPRR